jgi:hypothetical protein
MEKTSSEMSLVDIGLDEISIWQGKLSMSGKLKKF